MRHPYYSCCVIYSAFVLVKSRDLTVELALRNNFSPEELSRYPELEQKGHKLQLLAKAFAVKPADDATAIAAAFFAQADKLGMGLNEEAITAQVQAFGDSQAHGSRHNNDLLAVETHILSLHVLILKVSQ